MTFVIIIASFAVFFGGIVAFYRRYECRERREEAEWHEQSRRGCEETAAYFKSESDREKARVDELSQLSWTELRAWHERLSGEPCECAKKREIAMNIYWHERRLEKRAPKDHKQTSKLGDRTDTRTRPPLVNAENR